MFRLPADVKSRKSVQRLVVDGARFCHQVFPQFQDFIVVHDYLVTPDRQMQARIRRRGQNGRALVGWDDIVFSDPYKHERNVISTIIIQKDFKYLGICSFEPQRQPKSPVSARIISEHLFYISFIMTICTLL